MAPPAPWPLARTVVSPARVSANHANVKSQEDFEDWHRLMLHCQNVHATHARMRAHPGIASHTSEQRRVACGVRCRRAHAHEHVPTKRWGTVNVQEGGGVP